MSSKEVDNDAEETGLETELPASWCRASFDQAFSTLTPEKKIQTKQYQKAGAFPVVDQGQSFIGGYTDDVSSAIEPREGLLIFGDHTRAFKRVTFPFAAGADGIKILRPLLFELDYAYYSCLSLRFPNKGYARHFSHLRKCTIPIAPENEQKRITSKLNELFSQLEEGERALERVRTLVERYRQSVLKAAVTGELTREWRKSQAVKHESGDVLLQHILSARRASLYQSAKPPVTLHDEELPVLPNGWTWASLDQLTIKITSGSRDWKQFYGSGEGVFIMAQNVRMRALEWSEKQLVNPPKGNRDAERSRISQGDLLVTIVGVNTGDVCHVKESLPDHFVCQSVALLRPVDVRTSPFLETFLAAKEGGQAQFAKTIYGAGRPHLSFDDLRALRVPLPGLTEQEVIEDMLATIDSDISGLERLLEVSEKKTVQGRQAVLAAAFTGQLVPQDPKDEPASVLLERIAAERASAVKAPRVTKKQTRRKKAKA